MGRLQDKVIVITGAGGGIGRATSLLIAREGARIVANDLGCTVEGEGRSNGPADETVRQIREAGGEAVANTDSVAEWDGAHRIIQCALDTFGRIDAVVNNAGNLFFEDFHDISEEHWRAIVDTHLNGSFFVSRAAIPHFREQGSGAFVHITSTSGLFGRRQQAHYAAAKLGITAMSRSMALEYDGTGIRSNCVGPISFSRMVQGTVLPEEVLEAFRKMEPARIAAMIAYLVSDAAADVNGQVFYVRGDEVFFINQCEASEPMTRQGGWTIEAIASEVMPQFRPMFGSMRAEEQSIVTAKKLA